MKIWGTVQKVSRPTLLCQEMSQMLPIPPHTAANTQAQMCHGTPDETSGLAARRTGFHYESAARRISSDCLTIQINDTGRQGSLHGLRLNPENGLVRQIALVIFQKFLIDRPASGESLIYTVPKSNAGLAHFP